MQFTLQTEKGEIQLTPMEVANMLMGQLTSAEKEDHTQLASTFVQYLSRNEVLHTVNPRELATMALGIGYYYRIFLEKNDVVVDMSDEHEDDSNSNNTTPNS